MSEVSPTIIVSGASGQLGCELKSLASTVGHYSFHFYDRADLDITDNEKIENIFQSLKPDVFINCAAYTSVDKAETDKDKAFMVNSIAVGQLAKNCKKFRTSLIQISSDYVYDNALESALKETDPTKPKGVYARSKLKGEILALRECPKTIIIRSSWIYSSYGHNFVKTMVRLLESKESINVVDDQRGAPTYARDLASLILTTIIPQVVENSEDKSIFGIYNYSNEGSTSWYNFAHEIQRQISSSCEIHPLSTKEFGAPAPRPQNSVLDLSKIKSTFSIQDIPYWKDSLSVCLSELKN